MIKVIFEFYVGSKVVVIFHSIRYVAELMCCTVVALVNNTAQCSN